MLPMRATTLEFCHDVWYEQSRTVGQVSTDTSLITLLAISIHTSVTNTQMDRVMDDLRWRTDPEAAVVAGDSAGPQA